MTLLAKMDDIVVATRLDRLIFMTMLPRTFRWSPLFVIAASVAGYVLMTNAGSPLKSDFWIGWLIFYGAFLGALFLRAFGPRFAPTARHPLDERQLALKARAHALSGVLITGVAMLGCFYMASIGVPGLWHPHAYDWFNLGFGFQTVGVLLPTWIASWLEPRAISDGEE